MRSICIKGLSTFSLGFSGVIVHVIFPSVLILSLPALFSDPRLPDPVNHTPSLSFPLTLPIFTCTIHVFSSVVRSFVASVSMTQNPSPLLPTVHVCHHRTRALSCLTRNVTS